VLSFELFEVYILLILVLFCFFCFNFGLWTLFCCYLFLCKKVFKNLHYFYFGVYLYQEEGLLQLCVVYFLLHCLGVSFVLVRLVCFLLSFPSFAFVLLVFALCGMLPSFIPAGSLHRLLFVRSALTGRACLLQNYSVAFYFFLPLKKLLLVSDFFILL